MVSLDQIIEQFEDPDKIAALSDCGEGVRRMLDEIESADDASDPNQELAGAVLRLIVFGKEHLVVVRPSAQTGTASNFRSAAPALSAMAATASMILLITQKQRTHSNFCYNFAIQPPGTV